MTAEYLLWWSKQPNAGPPLLTTSPPNGANGVPGAVPGSTVLLNAGDVGDTFRDGVRFGLTYWFGRLRIVRFRRPHFLHRQPHGHLPGQLEPVPNGLFRPFFVANPVVPAARRSANSAKLITAPGSPTGRLPPEHEFTFGGPRPTIAITYAVLRLRQPTWRVDLFAGFRYLDLDESLTMTEDVTRTPPARLSRTKWSAPASSTARGSPRTTTSTAARSARPPATARIDWTLDLRATVALGTTHEQLEINGSQIRTIPGGPTLVFPGGLFALPTNIGNFTRDVFAVVPEVGLNVGYQVTDHLRAFVGYNFLYWSNVIRPGDQIDRVLDVNNIPRFAGAAGSDPPVFPPRPAPRFNDTDFWAQGVNLGVEFRW